MKNSTKRFIFLLAVIVLVATLAFALVACGEKEANTQTPPTGGDTPSTGGNTPSTGGNTPAIGAEFTVTLDVEGCKPLEKTEYTVQFGKPYQLPVPKPANEIYTEFLGWAYNGIRLSASDGSIANWNIEQNATLKAEFGGCVLLVKDGTIVGHSDRIALVSDLVIPSEIDGQKITSIGDHAFENCKTITSVCIPDSVTTIGMQAFWCCCSIETLTFGNGIKSIGDDAFEGCTNITKVNCLGTLKGWCEIEVGNNFSNPLLGSSTAKLYVNDEEVAGDVNIPSGTSKIGDYAFCDLKGITSITIPNSVQSIGDGAFANTNITTATMPAQVISFILQDCHCLTTVTITSGEIGSEAFSDCIYLQTVTIGENVTSIGQNIFNGCHKLVHIRNLSGITVASPAAIDGEVVSTEDAEFQNKLEKDENGILTYTVGDMVYAIGYEGTDTNLDLSLNGDINAIYPYAFYRNSRIGSVTIPDSVTSIGDRAFHNCAGLQTVTIGEGVQSIGSGAFYACTLLQKATINAQSIGDMAFSYCANLRTVTIGENVTSIGSGAFASTNITTATLPAQLISFIPQDCLTTVTITSGEIVNMAFGGLYRCRYLQTVTIGENVTSIGVGAFYGCTGLQTVTFSGESKLKEIGQSAFEGCNNLEAITIPASVTSIGSRAFFGCILDDVTFEDPTGWQYDSNDRQDIPEEQLRDHATAAELLTSEFGITKQIKK